MISTARAPALRGCEITLSLPSVGATENVILAACGAEGTTVLCNAAREPEIADLQAFLCAMRRRRARRGHLHDRHPGPPALHGCEHTGHLGPHRRGHLSCRRCLGRRRRCWCAMWTTATCSPVTAALKEAGCTRAQPYWTGSSCAAAGRLSEPSGRCATAPYPGFPTDAQAILMAALLKSRGHHGIHRKYF